MLEMKLGSMEWWEFFWPIGLGLIEENW